MGRSKLDDGNCDINSKLGDGVCNDTEDCSGWLRMLVPRMSVLDSGSNPGILVPRMSVLDSGSTPGMLVPWMSVLDSGSNPGMLVPRMSMLDSGSTPGALVPRMSVMDSGTLVLRMSVMDSERTLGTLLEGETGIAKGDEETRTVSVAAVATILELTTTVVTGSAADADDMTAKLFSNCGDEDIFTSLEIASTVELGIGLGTIWPVLVLGVTVEDGDSLGVSVRGVRVFVDKLDDCGKLDACITGGNMGRVLVGTLTICVLVLLNSLLLVAASAMGVPSGIDELVLGSALLVVAGITVGVVSGIGKLVVWN